MVLYARQWVNCHADAEDVFHDAFVQFWRNAGSARNPTAYLYRCIRTVAIDWSRSPKRRDSDLTDNDTALLVAAGADSDAEERREHLEQTLRQLPSEQREVLILKHWGGLTFEGIGETLDIPPRTAQSRYRYGVARLRELMLEARES